MSTAHTNMERFSGTNENENDNENVNVNMPKRYENDSENGAKKENGVNNRNWNAFVGKEFNHQSDNSLSGSQPGARNEIENQGSRDNVNVDRVQSSEAPVELIPVAVPVPWGGNNAGLGRRAHGLLHPNQGYYEADPGMWPRGAGVGGSRERWRDINHAVPATRNERANERFGDMDMARSGMGRNNRENRVIMRGNNSNRGSRGGNFRGERANRRFYAQRNNGPHHHQPIMARNERLEPDLEPPKSQAQSQAQPSAASSAPSSARTKAASACASVSSSSEQVGIPAVSYAPFHPQDWRVLHQQQHMPHPLEPLSSLMQHMHIDKTYPSREEGEGPHHPPLRGGGHPDSHPQASHDPFIAAAPGPVPALLARDDRPAIPAMDGRFDDLHRPANPPPAHAAAPSHHHVIHHQHHDTLLGRSATQQPPMHFGRQPYQSPYVSCHQAQQPLHRAHHSPANAYFNKDGGDNSGGGSGGGGGLSMPYLSPHPSITMRPSDQHDAAGHNPRQAQGLQPHVQQRQAQGRGQARGQGQGQGGHPLSQLYGPALRHAMHTDMPPQQGRTPHPHSLGSDATPHPPHPHPNLHGYPYSHLGPHSYLHTPQTAYNAYYGTGSGNPTDDVANADVARGPREGRGRGRRGRASRAGRIEGRRGPVVYEYAPGHAAPPPPPPPLPSAPAASSAPAAAAPKVPDMM